MSASALLQEHADESWASEAELISALLENAAEQAQVSISDLEEMAGGKIEIDSLVLKALNSIQATSESLPTNAVDVREKLTDLAEQLKKETSSPSRLISQVAFPCVNCHQPVPVMIGELPGSTAHARCPACSARLVAHRKLDGDVLSKILAPKVAPESPLVERNLTCPNCQASLSYSPKPGGPKIVIRNCFHCDWRLLIDTATDTITEAGATEPLITHYTAVRDKAILTCPDCQLPLTVPNRNGKLVKTSCLRCTKLIHATNSTMQPENPSLGPR